jgi:hypothetical protein
MAKGVVVLSIVNGGRGSALAPFLMLDIASNHQVSAEGVTGNGHEGLPRIPHAENPSSHYEWGGDATSVVHPGTQLDVAGIEVAVIRSTGNLVPVDDLRFVYAIAADGCPRVDSGDDISGSLHIGDARRSRTVAYAHDSA